MSLFDKAIDPSIVAPATVTPIAPVAAAPMSFDEAPKKKRDAPEAWGNTGVMLNGVPHYFQRKFFRIEKEQKLDAFILAQYEAKYNEHMAVEGAKASDFKFRMVTFLDVVPANGSTSEEITGELEMAITNA